MTHIHTFEVRAIRGTDDAVKVCVHCGDVYPVRPFTEEEIQRFN